MKKIFAVTIAVLITLASFSGCELNTVTIPASDPYNLIIVLGVRANAKTPDLSLLSEDLLNAATSAAKVTIIVADGDPFIFASVSLQKISYGLSETNRCKKKTSYAAQLVQLCSEAAAKTDEADIYKSLALTSRCVTGSADHIVVLENGLGTTGRVDFTKAPLSRIDVRELADNILDGSYCLDMKGASVELFGLGEVAGVQPELSMGDYKSLVDFYQVLFEKSNANVSVKTTPFSTSGEVQSSHRVKVCPVSSDICKIPIKPEASPDEAVTPTPKEAAPLTDGMVIDIPTTSVGFIADSAELLDPAAAADALADISNSLKLSGSDMVLVGMTATSGNADDAKELSVKRAETVRTLLENMGVDTADYTAIGTGYSGENPFHVNDIENNKLIEPKAVMNRTVLLMTLTTAENAGLIEGE